MFLDFQCPECGCERSKFVGKYSPSLPICECGELMECKGETNTPDFPHVSSRGKMYARPIHSDAMAICPDQVTEHKRLFPDIKLDSQCRPIFDNFKDHQDYLDKTGYVKLPARRKRKPTKK